MVSEAGRFSLKSVWNAHRLFMLWKLEKLARNFYVLVEGHTESLTTLWDQGKGRKGNGTLNVREEAGKNPLLVYTDGFIELSRTTSLASFLYYTLS